ncbi:MAG: TrmH family RNA methyltransferase [Betaproteobacteria bacterium]
MHPNLDVAALPSAGWRHPQIQRIRHVIGNTSPDRHRLFVAEGLWAHDILARLGSAVEVFLWCPELAYSDEAQRSGRETAGRARSAYRVAPPVLERLCERDRADGLLSLVELPTWDPAAVRIGPESLVLVADGIEIPGNLGTLVRTLDACGGDCVLLTNRRSRLAHPKVFRGSRGMNLRVPIVEFDDPAEAVRWLRSRDFDIFLATVTAHALPYQDVGFGVRTAIVVGNERYGIAPAWFDQGLTEVTIPMYGWADSLNVAVSASILLYEARRRVGGRT